MQKQRPTSRSKSDHAVTSRVSTSTEKHPVSHKEAACDAATSSPGAAAPAHRRPSLMTDSTGVVLQTDLNGRLVFLNERGRSLFGCDDGCIGTDVFAALAGPAAPRFSSGASGRSFPALRTYFNGEHKHRLRDGEEAWISWSARTVQDGSGRDAGLICTGIDVTEFRRFKDRASAYIDALAFLSHAGMYFVEHTNRRDLYRFVGAQLHRLLKGAFVIVCSYDRTANAVTVTGLWGEKKESEVLQQLIGRPLAGMVFPLPEEARHAVLGKPVVRIPNVHELSFRSLPLTVCENIERTLGLGNIYALPLAVQNERLGAAVLMTRSREALPDRQLIEAFIAQASVALKRVITEEEVARAAGEWRTTFDSISDILFVTDRDSRIQRVNRACADLLQLKPGDLIGKCCADVFPPDFPPAHAAFSARVFDRKTKVLHEFCDRGCTRFYELSLTPVLDERGEPVRVINVIKEITERKKAEEILQRIVQEKTEALQGTRRELENARRLSDIGVLAATIAHEIRNPLAAIKTAAYNIRRKSRNPDLESHLANIDKKVMESDQIIRNLLSYSRIKLPNYEWVPVAGILNESIDALADKYARREIAITRDLAAVADTLIEADPVHLKVLFNNILDNACQSFVEGRGSVHVAARLAARQLTVTIRDTGAGISPEELKRLSEPFFTTKSRGIGLGLTICFQIANLHRGRIQIDSEKGKGTTVSVTLPLSRSSS